MKLVSYNRRFDLVLARYGEPLGQEGGIGLVRRWFRRAVSAAHRPGQYMTDGCVWEGEIRIDQMTTEGA